MPAVVYGLGRDPYACVIDRREFERELQSGNRTFKLGVGGKSEAALLQDIQYDSLGIDIVHVDFKRIDLAAKVTVLVPVEFVGQPEPTAGAVLDHVAGEIHVECLPTKIPRSVECVVTGLKIGEHVEAKDLKLPDGVALADDPHKTIASYHYKHVEAEVPAAAAAGAEGAEPIVLTEKKTEEEGEKAEKPEKPEKK